MKKWIVFIPAMFCLMLSSCGTDIEQSEYEPAAAVTAFQAETTAVQKAAAAESTSNTECCIPQISSDAVPNEAGAPGCCSPALSQIGGCCGE